jgi:hypothetical protein
MAIVVMMIGRARLRPASTSASSRGAPRPPQGKDIRSSLCSQ